PLILEIALRLNGLGDGMQRGCNPRACSSSSLSSCVRPRVSPPLSECCQGISVSEALPDDG
ncbi:hypothetical protein KUCAC02_029421, partial [Chaenocephalus aceratus]